MANKKLSRVLALVIALVMVFSALPMQSFALTSADANAAEQIPQVGINVKQQGTLLTLNKALDGSWDYEGLKKSIFENCLEITGVENLTYDKFTYEYKVLNGLGVDDGILSGLYYDIAVNTVPQDKGETYRYIRKGGDFTVKVSIPESSNYMGAEAVFKIKVNTADPYAYEIALKPDYNTEYTLGYDKNGEFNYEKLRQDIFAGVVDTSKYSDVVNYENAKITYQILNDLGVDDGILSGHYYDFEQRHLDADQGGTYRYLYKGGSFNVKIMIPATENRRASEKIVKVNVKVAERVSSNVILKNVVTDYNKDTEVIKSAIFNTIDMYASKLPQGVTKDDFIFEYKALVMLAGGTPGATYEWSPLEGGNGPASTYYNKIGAGSHEIRVRFRGNENYKESNWVNALLTVNFSKVNITFSQNSMYFNEKLPKDYIKTDVNDSFNKFEIFVKTSADDATIYIDSPEGLDATKDFAANIPFNDVLIKIFGIDGVLSADEVYYRRGLSRSELSTLLTSDIFRGYVKSAFGIDAKACDMFLGELNALPENVTHIWFKIGKPTTPSAYRAIGIAANANYETATAAQKFDVRFKSKGTKLQWMQNKSELNIISANSFDFSAVVTRNGYVVDSSHVKYIYTGFSLTGGLYISTKQPPRQAGIYTQTAYTGISGRYAFPKTRTFIIGL